MDDDQPDTAVFLNQLKYLVLLLLVVMVLYVPLGNTRYRETETSKRGCNSCTLCRVYCKTNQGVQSVGSWLNLSMEPVRDALREVKLAFYRFLMKWDGADLCGACLEREESRCYKTNKSYCSSYCRRRKSCKRCACDSK